MLNKNKTKQTNKKLLLHIHILIFILENKTKQNTYNLCIFDQGKGRKWLVFGQGTLINFLPYFPGGNESIQIMFLNQRYYHLLSDRLKMKAMINENWHLS